MAAGHAPNAGEPMSAIGSRRIAALGLLATGLTGCITAAEQATPIRPITCTAGADCDAKWSRAASSIALNPTWKIKTRTDQIMETTGHDTLPAFAVTKVATTPGNYEITFEGACDNPFGCTPTVAQSRARFESFMLAQ
jgi:hypothetical protein